MKLKLLATFGMAVTAAAAFALTPTNSNVISETPEGLLIDPCYSSSAKTWLVASGGLGSMANNDGYASKMVRTDDAVYIYDIISENKLSDYWVKGDIQDNGTVVFHFPQLVYKGETDASNLYVSMSTPTKSDNGITLTVEEGKCDLNMKFEGDRLVQIMPEEMEDFPGLTGIIGLFDDKGLFTGFGEQNVSYRTIAPQLSFPPETLSADDYSFEYIDGSGKSCQRAISIGVENNDVWIKGLNSFIPESWVKGTLDGEKVTIPSTYTGVYQNILTYVTGLSADEMSLVNPFTLTKDGDNYKADSKFMINLGDTRVNLHENRVFSDAVMSPLVSGPRTPSAPVIDDSEEGCEYDPNDDMTAICFMLEPVDVDGNPLDVNKLFYEVSINNELYTFPADYYGEEMTQVPYNYGCDLIYNLDGYIMIFYFGKADTLSIRALYKDGDNVTYSEPATFSFEGSGIETVNGRNNVVATEYYSLDGRRVANSSNGIRIKVSHNADGTSTVTKEIAR